MATLSVPIPANLEEFIKRQIKEGRGANKADVVRRAITRLSEEEAVNAVLRSEQEATVGKILSGDLRELVKRYRDNA
ncbi:MAG: type II toxin-antitoxin system ParD family antitoxin [Patescibacteria group bacterium]